MWPRTPFRPLFRCLCDAQRRVGFRRKQSQITFGRHRCACIVRSSKGSKQDRGLSVLKGRPFEYACMLAKSIVELFQSVPMPDQKVETIRRGSENCDDTPRSIFLFPRQANSLTYYTCWLVGWLVGWLVDHDTGRVIGMKLMMMLATTTTNTRDPVLSPKPDALLPKRRTTNAEY